MLPPAFLRPADRDELLASMKCFAGVDGPSSVPFEYKIAEGNAAAEILATAAAVPSDLLVVGTHGRSGFERPSVRHPRDLSTEEAPGLRILAFSGGEPWMRRDIYSPTRFLKRTDLEGGCQC
jgi:hypothetical protein